MITHSHTVVTPVLGVFARLALVLAAALAIAFPAGLAQARDSVLSPDVTPVYVDDNYNSSTPGWGVDHFATIQEGVDAVEAGGEVQVAVGVYVEEVIVTKSLTLRGARNGVDPRPTGAGARPGGESILRPSAINRFGANLITVKANNVTVDGFTFDGNNPSLGPCPPEDQNVSNGVCLHVAGGVANGNELDGYATTISNLVVVNNIFKNLNLFGVTVSSNSRTPTGGHMVAYNVLDNMAGGETPYGSRKAVRMIRNQYVHVHDNKITRCRIGIDVNLFNRPTPNTPALISGNDVESVREAISLNSVTQTSSPVTIENNILRTVSEPSVRNTGIRVYTIKDTAQIVIDGNQVAPGALHGVYLYNLDIVNPVQITDLQVTSPISVGVALVNDRLGFDVAGKASAVVNGGRLSGGFAGVRVLDQAEPEIDSTLVMTVTNDTEITGAQAGAMVSGPKATLNLLGNDGGAGISNNQIGVVAKGLGNLNAVGNLIDDNQVGLAVVDGAWLDKVEQNWITGSLTHGVLITGTHDGGGTIFNNAISGSGTLNAWNTTSEAVEMPGNYWGSASPAAVAGKVNGSVDYSPWLNTGTDVNPAPDSPGFQGSFSQLTVDDLASEVSPSALQEGVDMTLATGTLTVSPGTYPGDVTINKDITMNIAGEVTVDGYVIQQAGTLVAPSSNLTLLGDFMRYGGTFTPGNGTVRMLGSTVQRLGGPALTGFYNLLIGSGAHVEMVGAVRVDHSLNLSQGLIDVKSSSLTLGQSAVVAGSPLGNTNMVVAQNVGSLCKEFSGAGSFTYPIGDLTGTANYSPATIQFTSGNFSGAAACARLGDARYPYNYAVNHISRYWAVSTTGISGYSANLTFNYLGSDEDVEGNEAVMYGLVFSGSSLIQQAAAVNGGANTIQFTSSDINGKVYTAGNAAPQVTLVSASVARESPTLARVSWSVGTEAEILGYNVWRSTSLDGPRTQINGSLILPKGPGSSYQQTDSSITTGITYYYWIEVNSLNDNDYLYGPYVTLWVNLYLPLLSASR